MSDEAELMEWVSGFTTFLGLGQEIAGFFSPGLDLGELESMLQDMLTSLLNEVKEVFAQDLTGAAVATAVGILQTARDFFAVDYTIAQTAGESPQQLWNLLTVDNFGPSLQALRAQATTMTTWASDESASVGQQTVLLALAIYAMIVAIHRERAKYGPDVPTRTAEVATMRVYAALAVSRTSYFSSPCARRVSPPCRNLTRLTTPGTRPHFTRDPCWVAAIRPTQIIG